MDTWTVVYRTGGESNPEWHRTMAYTTKEKARRAAHNIEHGGRVALVFITRQLDAIGMPEGFGDHEIPRCAYGYDCHMLDRIE